MSIDNVDARFEDGQIEMGLFDGEENRDVIPVSFDDALALRDSLNEAIRLSLAHPDFPDDIFSTSDQEGACAEGWAIFEAHGYLEIEKDDNPESDDVPEFESDDAAIAHVEARAAAGSTLHHRALVIHRKYEDAIRKAAAGQSREDDE